MRSMMEKKGASPKVEEDTAAYRIPFVLLIASTKIIGLKKSFAKVHIFCCRYCLYCLKLNLFTIRRFTIYD